MTVAIYAQNVENVYPLQTLVCVINVEKYLNVRKQFEASCRTCIAKLKQSGKVSNNN